MSDKQLGIIGIGNMGAAILKGILGSNVLKSEDVIIYDINGALLFYEFSVIKDDKIVGRIRVSASKILGPAVYTMEVGPRKWDAEKAIDRAKKLILDRYKEVEIISTQIVCYSYPKIGGHLYRHSVVFNKIDWCKWIFTELPNRER